MSERLRQAYLKKEERELERKARRLNAKHLGRMKLAGEKFKQRHLHGDNSDENTTS